MFDSHRSCYKAAVLLAALGWVLLAGVPQAYSQGGGIALVSAASYRPQVARGSIVAVFGLNLAPSVQQAKLDEEGNLPTEMNGVSVAVNGRNAQLFFASPGQINLILPDATEPGIATVVVLRQGVPVAEATAQVVNAAPALFSSSGTGQGAGAILNGVTLRGGLFGTQTHENPGDDKRTRIAVFATGVRYAEGEVSAAVGDSDGRRTNLAVEYAGPAPGYQGLDQINLVLEEELIGAGDLNLVITADSTASNSVSFRVADGNISIIDVWSDQFPNGNVVNCLPAGGACSGAGVNSVDQISKPYILMGASEDNRVRVSVAIDAQGPLDRLLLRLATIDSGGAFAPTGIALLGLNEVALIAPTDFSLSSRPYAIVAGFETNGAEGLQADEIQSVFSGLRVVSREAYEQSQIALRAAAVAAPVLGWPNASDLLLSFLDGRAPRRAEAPSEDSVVSVYAKELSHHVGGDFSTDGAAVIPRYKFANDSQLAEAVRASAAFRDAITDSLLKGSQFGAESCGIDNGAILPMVGNHGDGSNFLTFAEWSFPDDHDLYYSMGTANLNAQVSPLLERSAGRLRTKSVQIRGLLRDLYDWDRDSGATGFARDLIDRAATVQAGYGSLGVGGRIFRTEIDLSGSIPFEFDFGPLSSPVEVTPADAWRISIRRGSRQGSESRTYFLQNVGQEQALYSISTDAPWLTLTTLSGSLAPGERRELMVVLNQLVDALTPGTHTATIAIRGSGCGAAQVLQVALVVEQGQPPANSGPWIGNWNLVNFLAIDDGGIWDPDDLAGIGLLQEITEQKWILHDEFEGGCSVTFSYSVDDNFQFSRQVTNADTQCPPGLAAFSDSGTLEFSSDNQFMTEYYDLLPGDEILAFRWLRAN